MGAYMRELNDGLHFKLKLFILTINYKDKRFFTILILLLFFIKLEKLNFVKFYFFKHFIISYLFNLNNMILYLVFNKINTVKLFLKTQ